jgi:hypothetical protein
MSQKNQVSRLRPIAITPELQEALKYVETAAGNNGDGMCRFEFYIPEDKALQRALRPLEELLWKHDDPSITYYRKGRLHRCRFTVPARAFQSVFDAWEQVNYLGKKSFAPTNPNTGGRKVTHEAA